MDRSSLYSQFIEGELDFFRLKIEKLNSDFELFSLSKCLVSLRSYLLTECDFYCLPTIAYEINLKRLQGQLRGKTTQDKYRYYFEHFNVFEDYPKLAELLGEFVTSTSNSYYRAIENIKYDRSILIKHFGLPFDDTVDEIGIFQNGDRHRNGEQTLKLTFKSGITLIYKPQIIQNERLVAEIFNFVNDHIEGEGVKNYLFLEKEGRLYREFVDYKGKINSLGDCQKFYSQIGRILAICYLTNTTDIHMENLVARGKDIFLIDREAFFHHNRLIGFNDENDLFSTGLLRNPDEKGNKLGEATGIFGGEEQRSSLTVPLIQNDGTDRLSIKFIGVSRFRQHNRIKDANGNIVDPLLFLDTIADSFMDVIQLFTTHRNLVINILNKHKNAKNRQIVRKTSLYAGYIRQLFQPMNLKNKTYKDEIKKHLLSLCTGENEGTKILVDYEIEELTKCNIPYFYTELFSNSLFNGNGILFENFFEKTPYEEFCDKLNTISGKDLRDELIASFGVNPSL